VLPKSPLGQAIGYGLPRWDGLIRYCEDGELSIDNNLAEGAIRPCTLGRKNYLFFGSDRGGRTAAVWYSLVASCKVHQVEPWAYLQDTLGHLAKLDFAVPDAARLMPLLPDVWRDAHREARRKWSR
jgi:transposase